MSQIEVYVLEHGFYSIEYIEVPNDIKKQQSQDIFLYWLYTPQGFQEAPITMLFPKYPDLEAVFVSNWIEDSDESIN